MSMCIYNIHTIRTFGEMCFELCRLWLPYVTVPHDRCFFLTQGYFANRNGMAHQHEVMGRASLGPTSHNSCQSTPFPFLSYLDSRIGTRWRTPMMTCRMPRTRCWPRPLLSASSTRTFLVLICPWLAVCASHQCQPPVPTTSARDRSVLNFRLCCSCSWLHNSWSSWVLLWGVHTSIGPSTLKILIGHTWTPRMELWQTWFGHCLRISSQHSSSQTLFYACTLAQTALPFCQSCIGISGASGALQATTLMSNPSHKECGFILYHIYI